MSTLPNDQDGDSTKNHAGNKENPPKQSRVLDATRRWLLRWWDAPHEKSKPADWAMVALTVVIAIAAFWSLCILEGQLKEAQRATNITQNQWKEQQRPWVGLEQSRITPIASPEYSWSLAVQYPTIWVTVSYSVKNFGISPAFREREWFKVVPVSDKAGYEPIFPDACQMAETHQPPTDKLEMGYVIFPSTSMEKNYGVNIMSDVNRAKELKRVWIDFCVAYQDSGDKWHHSRYRGVSVSNGPIRTFPDHPGWSYVPLEAFSLEAVQAD